MANLAKLICVLVSVLLTNMNLILIAPMYPILAKDRGISELMIGIVFMTCPLFSCVSSIFVGKKINSFGRRKIALAGLILAASSLLGMTFVNYYENFYFLLLSIAARALGGVGVACVYISGLSVISVDFHENREKYTSMMEAFGGLGLMIAPLYAAFSYPVIGFSGTFFFLGVFIMFYLPIHCICTHSPGVVPLEHKIPSRFCFNRNFVLDLSVLVYCYTILCFLEPTVSIYLESRGLNETSIGLVFTGMTMTYTLTNFSIAYIGHYVQVAKLVNVSAGVCLTGLVLAGAVGEVSGFLWVTIMGIMMCGVGTALAFVSVLPALLKEMSMLGINDRSVYGDVSSVFSMGMNLGEIAGPLVSGLLSLMFDFATSSIILSGVGVSLLIGQIVLKTRDYSKVQHLLDESDIDYSSIS